jgi:hypothetical protein
MCDPVNKTKFRALDVTLIAILTSSEPPKKVRLWNFFVRPSKYIREPNGWVYGVLVQQWHAEETVAWVNLQDYEDGSRSLANVLDIVRYLRFFGIIIDKY